MSTLLIETSRNFTENMVLIITIIGILFIIGVVLFVYWKMNTQIDHQMSPSSMQHTLLSPSESVSRSPSSSISSSSSSSHYNLKQRNVPFVYNKQSNHIDGETISTLIRDFTLNC